MECKFNKCCWNKKGACVNRASLILMHDNGKIVKCNKYNRKGKENMINDFSLFNRR